MKTKKNFKLTEEQANLLDSTSLLYKLDLVVFYDPDKRHHNIEDCETGEILTVYDGACQILEAIEEDEGERLCQFMGYTDILNLNEIYHIMNIKSGVFDGETKIIHID